MFLDGRKSYVVVSAREMKDTTISLKIERALKAKLLALAKQENRTLSNFIEKLLKRRSRPTSRSTDGSKPHKCTGRRMPEGPAECGDASHGLLGGAQENQAEGAQHTKKGSFCKNELSYLSDA